MPTLSTITRACLTSAKLFAGNFFQKSRNINVLGGLDELGKFMPRKIDLHAPDGMQQLTLFEPKVEFETDNEEEDFQMRLDTVESDAIHAIGYDNEVQVLEVIFNIGSIYQYRGVPRDVYDEMMRAESKGKYFQDNVREEFDYWQWDPDTAKWVRAEQKSESEAARGSTNPEMTD